jgi:hypothetical protein
MIVIQNLQSFPFLQPIFPFTEIIFLLKTGKKLLMTLQYNVLTFWEIINDDDSFGVLKN